MALVLFAFNGNAQKISDLNLDKDFQTYLLNEFNFLKTNNPELIKEIGTLKDKSQLNEFYKAFNTNEKEYISFLDKQNEIILEIS